MRRMMIAAAGAAALAAMGAKAPSPPVWGGQQANFYVVTKRVWASAPSQADIAAVYPKKALAKGLSGQALMRCRLTTDGALEDCRVAGEDPEGQGFAAAARALAPKFHFIMATVDPAVMGKLAVDVPVVFEPPGRQRTIDHPEWLRTLPADKMQEVFPPKAADAGLTTGRAVVDCVADGRGGLGGCEALSEDPPGMDFGPAAVRVASVMGINPWTADGRPADGAHVRFALRLNKGR